MPVNLEKQRARHSGLVRDLLWSADSMAWSFHARMHGRNGNDIGEAARYLQRVATMPVQESLFLGLAGGLRRL